MTEWEKKIPETPRSDRQKQTDDFWDIESLLPAKPTRRQTPPPRRSIEVVEMDLSVSPQKNSSTESRKVVREEPVSAEPVSGSSLTVRYVPPHKAGEEDAPAPLLEYEPDGALLHSVKIYGWQANYHYFDSFVEDALRYDAMTPPKSAEKKTFFSYFPQYAQMGHRAAAWYLFWREHVRRGQYLDTDYSYVLLYLFELINLPAEDIATARAHRDLMAKVWMAYRKPYVQLDHYMCEWLCDYCLIHALPAPVDLLASALDEIIMESRLKEFYLSAAVRVPEAHADGGDTRMETARILMRHCCQYDYRKSKFAQGEHKALFDSTIPAAVAHVLPLLLGADGRKPAITLLDSTVTRDAFVGALCSHRNKRKIEVAYTSFSRSHELRFLIGDMVKHVENRLRSWIGVRSRLSVMSLPIPLRDALDAYLAPMEPPKSAPVIKKKEEPRPAYEALYDLPRKEISLDDAAAIEAQSWETTRILIEAFEGEEPLPQSPVKEKAVTESSAVPVTPPVPAVEPHAPPVLASEQLAETASPLAPYALFIKAALDEDSAALRAAAKAIGKMPDAIADEVNALTADSDIGDIILEDDGMGSYVVIEDYRDAVVAMIEG